MSAKSEVCRIKKLHFRKEKYESPQEWRRVDMWVWVVSEKIEEVDTIHYLAVIIISVDGGMGEEVSNKFLKGKKI